MVQGPKIYLMRHGKAQNNIIKIHSSCSFNSPRPEETIVLVDNRRVPFFNPLTEEGVQTVKAATQQLMTLKIDAIFYSDLLRAKQTADIIGGVTRAKTFFDLRLRENDYGIFNGMNEDFAWQWLRGQTMPCQTRFPNGESLQEFYDRLMTFYDYLDQICKGRRILVVSHKFGLTVLEKGAVERITISEIVRFQKQHNDSLIKPGEIRKIKYRRQ